MKPFPEPSIKAALYPDNALKVLDGLIENKVLVDLIVTDPPYETTSRGSSGDTGGILTDALNMKGKVFEYNDTDIAEWIDKAYAVLKDGGHCYIMCNNKNLLHYLTVINNSKFKVFKTLIWSKDNCITNMYYMDSHEYIIFCRKGKAVKINNCGTRSVLKVKNPKPKIHPTEKPVELMDILIQNSSRENETVLDPFMGSGSVGVSCIKNKRNFIGVEIDKGFYEIANERIGEKTK